MRCAPALAGFAEEVKKAVELLEDCCTALYCAVVAEQLALTRVQALQQVVHRQAAEVLAILVQDGGAEDVAAAQSL
jgi:hypothetical protein